MCVAGDTHWHHHRHCLDVKSWPADAQLLSIVLFFRTVPGPCIAFFGTISGVCVAGEKHRHHHRHYLDAKSWPAGAQFLSILLPIVFVSAIWFSSFRAPSARPRVQVRASYIGRFRPAGAGTRVVGAPFARFHNGRSVDAQWTLSGRSVDAAVDAQWTLSFYEVFCARDEK